MIDEQLIIDTTTNILTIDSIIHSWKTSNKLYKLLHYIKCDIRYNYKVIDGPKIYENISTGEETCYEYTIRLISRTIRLFGIDIYKIEV